MRRKTNWAGFGDSAGAANLPGFAALSAGTPQIISTGAIVGGAAGFFEEEVTITRTIGRFAATLDAATADLTGTVAVGCGVFRGESITAGVTSLPSPEDDPDFEWLYYGVFGLAQGGTADQVPAIPVVIDFDVRGQRVLRSGWTVAWVAEAQTTTIRAMVGGRYLVKLT